MTAFETALIVFCVLLICGCAALGGLFAWQRGQTRWLDGSLDAAVEAQADAEERAARSHAQARSRAKQPPPRLGLSFRTSDPEVSALFGKVQGVVDKLQVFGCQAGAAYVETQRREAIAAVRQQLDAADDSGQPTSCAEIQKLGATLAAEITQNAAGIAGPTAATVRDLAAAVETLWESIVESCCSKDGSISIDRLDALSHAAFSAMCP